MYFPLIQLKKLNLGQSLKLCENSIRNPGCSFHQLANSRRVVCYPNALNTTIDRFKNTSLIEMNNEVTNTRHLKDGIIDFIAGSLGGIALVYTGQPLDTVKVKLQTFPHLYKNMFQCFHDTFRKEGLFKGLYAGTVPALVANVAENSVLFAAYGGCQKFIKFITNKNSSENLSVLGNASAGCLAAFFSSFTLCPTELIKCKLQAAREVQMSKGYTMVKLSPYKVTQQVIEQEGYKGLFRGLGSTIAREMPGYFVFFGGYELTRSLLMPKDFEVESVGPTATMIAGAAGGIAFWVVVFPADVVKSRLQVSNLEGNLFKLIYQIGKQEGIMALYSGLGPTLLRTIPATAVLFVTFEGVREVLHSWLEPESMPSDIKHF